ncbi:MAG: PEP-CTERM sorting domain-containing protein [Planctomycetota bacterium]
MRCRSFLSTLVMLGVVLILLGSSANASIVVNFSDSAAGIFVQMTGTMDLSATSSQGSAITRDLDRMVFQPGGIITFESSGGRTYSAFAGNTVFLPITGQSYTRASSNGTGRSFGWLENQLYWDEAYGANPGVITVDRRFTIENRTIAGQFGTLLDNGPVAFWTHTASGDTISFALAIPEPTSYAMLGLSTLGLAYVRRRPR